MRSSGWVAPVPSVARTEIVYRPARAGVQGRCHWRQVVSLSSSARTAGCHSPSADPAGSLSVPAAAPASRSGGETRTSTAEMRRSIAQATPAIARRSPTATAAPSWGVSMRDWVLIGARCDHLGTQYVGLVEAGKLDLPAAVADT